MLGSFKYISLETFKRNGKGVKTPVWFVQKNNTIFVRTLEDSGKVKRIKATRKARIAPCDFNGKVLGEWIDVKVSIISDEVSADVGNLFRVKYGLSVWLTSLAARLRRKRYIYLRLEPIS